MNFKDECLLKARYLEEAAQGVKFQTLSKDWKDGSTAWVDVQFPTFNGPVENWRRLPKTCVYTRQLLWIKWPDQKEPTLKVFSNPRDRSSFLDQYPQVKVISEETLKLEVQE